MLWQCWPIVNWKKWKHSRKKARQAAVYLFCYYNGMQNLKGFSQVPILWKTYKSSLISGFTDPLVKEKIPDRLLITKKIEGKFHGYLWELYRHAVRVHTDEASFQDITDAMMKTFERRRLIEGINWVDIRGRVKGLNWVVKVSSWEVVQETQG